MSDDESMVLRVPADLVQEFIEECTASEVKVAGKPPEVRSIVNNLDTMLVFTGSGAVGLKVYQMVSVPLLGAALKVETLAKWLDRRAGGHSIFTDKMGKLTHGTTRDLPYGKVRVTAFKHYADIDATAVITDVGSRAVFVDKVFDLVGECGDIQELSGRIREIEEIERVEIFTAAGVRRAL